MRSKEHTILGCRELRVLVYNCSRMALPRLSMLSVKIAQGRQMNRTFLDLGCLEHLFRADPKCAGDLQLMQSGAS